jgi:proteasome lid subunit RPN8/RPN11
MLILNERHKEALIAHARKWLPNESCGLFAGEIQGEERIIREVYCLTNTDASAEHFSMAAEEQFKAIADIRKKRLVLLGNFHSHPNTPSRPSAEDIRLAFDPSLSYIIISLAGPEPVLKSFTIRQGAAEEEPITLREAPVSSGT